MRSAQSAIITTTTTTIATTVVVVVVVAVFVTLSVSRCAAQPWQRQQRERAQLTAAAAYEPSTAAATYAAAYEDDDSSAQRHETPDYGEPELVYAEPERVYAEPELNYEVDEAVSVLSDGRAHGVQQQQLSQHTMSPTTTTTTTTTDLGGFGSGATDSTTVAVIKSGAVETRKSGYVVDEKHYRKYRVEEETPDGFIVGEYGVVSHHDGTTRGVRYTADSSISPRVIYEALAKFLALR